MLIIYDGMCMLQCYFNTKSNDNEENNLEKPNHDNGLCFVVFSYFIPVIHIHIK